jgi:hypothetical protein
MLSSFAAYITAEESISLPLLSSNGKNTSITSVETS